MKLSQKWSWTFLGKKEAVSLLHFSIVVRQKSSLLTANFAMYVHLPTFTLHRVLQWLNTQAKLHWQTIKLAEETLFLLIINFLHSSSTIVFSVWLTVIGKHLVSTFSTVNLV